MRAVRYAAALTIAASVGACGFDAHPTSGTIACKPQGAACRPEGCICMGRGKVVDGGVSTGT